MDCWKVGPLSLTQDMLCEGKDKETGETWREDVILHDGIFILPSGLCHSKRSGEKEIGLNRPTKWLPGELETREGCIDEGPHFMMMCFTWNIQTKIRRSWPLKIMMCFTPICTNFDSYSLRLEVSLDLEKGQHLECMYTDPNILSATLFGAVLPIYKKFEFFYSNLIWG